MRVYGRLYHVQSLSSGSDCLFQYVMWWNFTVTYILSHKLWSLDCAKNSPRHVYGRRKRYQLSSTDAGRRIVTLSVHLCLQHCGRDATRRAASAAAVETCFDYDVLHCVLVCQYSDVTETQWTLMMDTWTVPCCVLPRTRQWRRWQLTDISFQTGARPLLRRAHCEKYPHIHEYFVASFPYFNQTGLYP